MKLAKTLNTERLTGFQALFYTHTAQKAVLINALTKPGVHINTELFDHFIEQYTITNMEYEVCKNEITDELFGNIAGVSWEINFEKSIIIATIESEDYIKILKNGGFYEVL